LMTEKAMKSEAYCITASHCITWKWMINDQ